MLSVMQIPTFQAPVRHAAAPTGFQRGIEELGHMIPGVPTSIQVSWFTHWKKNSMPRIFSYALNTQIKP